MAHFSYPICMLLVISLCQSEGSRVTLEQMAEAQFTTLENSSTNEGGMHEQARGKSVTSRLKHAYFDFDQTITRIHVFLNLCALGARVETGQVHKLMELDESTWKYDERSSKVVEDMSANGKPWSIAAMGGTYRIEKDIRPYLSVLKEAGVKLTVITKGNVGVARYILNQARLMDFFETVYGNIGKNYGPATTYDLNHTDPTWYEGEEGVNLGRWRSKLSLISELMKNNEATFSEAVLVEDDITEVNSVSSQCEAVHISERKGTEAVHLKQIIALAGIVTPQTPLSIQPTGLLQAALKP